MDRNQIHQIADLTKKIRLATDGDPDAVSETIELVTMHIQSVVSKIRRSFPGIKHLENSEADTTEVFLRLLINSRTMSRPFANRNEFVNACFATARNLLIDRLRWYQHQAISMESVEGHLPSSHDSDPAESAELSDDIRLLQMTLNSLEANDYALVSLIYFEGFSQTDAFRKLELAESTGRHQLQKIKTKIAAAMK